VARLNSASSEYSPATKTQRTIADPCSRQACEGMPPPKGMRSTVTCEPGGSNSLLAQKPFGHGMWVSAIGRIVRRWPAVGQSQR